MQNSARVATAVVQEQADRPTAAQQIAAFVPDVAAPPVSETFHCTECSRTLPATQIAFADSTGREGVCLTCDTEYAEAMAMPAPAIGREVA